MINQRIGDSYTFTHKQSPWHAILWVLLLGGGIGPIILIPHEYNAPFLISFKYLTGPMIVLNYLCAWRFPDMYFDTSSPRRKNRPVGAAERILLPALLGVMLTASSGAGIVNLVNAYVGESKLVTLTGTVEGKFLSGKHNDTRVVVLDPSSLNRRVKLTVGEATYQRLAIGAPYETQVWLGSLGYVYYKRLW